MKVSNEQGFSFVDEVMLDDSQKVEGKYLLSVFLLGPTERITLYSADDRSAEAVHIDGPVTRYELPFTKPKMQVYYDRSVAQYKLAQGPRARPLQVISRSTGSALLP